jgi:hypothetical protein
MRYVKYIGPAHIRQITAADWRSVGITGDQVVWSAQNGFAVPLDVFTDDQITKAIDDDPYLVVTGGDEDFTPTPQVRDMTPAQVVLVTENRVVVVGMLEGADKPSADDSEACEMPRGGGAAPTGSTGKGSSGHDEPK